MSTHPIDRHDPEGYEIRLRGELDERWSTWFDGMSLSTDDDRDGPVTVLRGQVVDQSALHGLLSRVRDVGLPLLSITPVGTER